MPDSFEFVGFLFTPSLSVCSLRFILTFLSGVSSELSDGGVTIILAEKVSTLPYLRDSQGEANIGGKEADTNHNILQYVKVCE